MKKQQILLMLLLAGLSATAQPNKKVGPALTKFLNTEFMIKYRDLRIAAESAALNVQSNQSALKQSDVFRLRSAYDQSAIRANQILDNIKQDFLNPKKLKSIAEFPEMYSDGLRFKLQELADFYAANFQQALADASISKENVDGSATLILVIELIGLAKGLTSYFSDIKREARQYTEVHLQENLVKPNRWRYWDELAGGASLYEPDKNNALNLDQPQTDDRLDTLLRKLDETISAPRENDRNSGGSDFNPPAEGEISQDTTSTLRYDDWSPTEASKDTTANKPNAPGQVKPAKAPTPVAKPAKKTQKPAAAKSDQINN